MHTHSTKTPAATLPPQIQRCATDGLLWVGGISGSVCATLVFVEGSMASELPAAWSNSVLQGAALSVCVFSVVLVLVQRAGWLTKSRLLDAGICLQVAVAFVGGLFEGALCTEPGREVVGISCIALWMMLCGNLLPNTPRKFASASALCTLMWPLAYSVDLGIFGYRPMRLGTLFS